MPDVHLPKLGDEEEGEAEAPKPAATSPPTAAHRSKWLLKIGLEVLLISTGVFLGLMGEQWRERAEHREIAEAALHRFRTEFRLNRDAVAAVLDKHVTKLKTLDAYFGSDPKQRPALLTLDTSTDPAFMEHAAWDLALATQSLAYIDQDLALSIAHVYAIQGQLDAATTAITQVMYASTDYPAFVRSGLMTYFGDCSLIEPRLIRSYDEILPRLDRALGDGAAQPHATH